MVTLEAGVFFLEAHVSGHELALLFGQESHTCVRRLFAHERELEPCLVFVPVAHRKHTCFTVRSVR